MIANIITIIFNSSFIKNIVSKKKLIPNLLYYYENK